MTQESDRIAELAAEYAARRPIESTSQRRQRETWLAADARHAHEYARFERLADRAAGLRDDPELQALKARDLAALHRHGWFHPRWALSAAAALVLLAVDYLVTSSVLQPPPPVSYVTALGERRTETLADGSQVVLNTDSAMEVRYTRGRRDIRLQRGEAQYQVAHDAARPFVVSAGDGTVTALGTRFQVRRDAAEAVVTLLEGKVEVAHGQARRTLSPNEQARLSGAGIAVQPIDPDQANGWLDGWLRFRGAPLGQVVAEANRYSARKLRLGDPALADIPLSGNFHAGDSASIASSVALILPVRVDDSGAEFVLLPQ